MTLARRCGDNAHNSDDDAKSEMDDMDGHGAEAVKLNLDEAHGILQFKADEEEGDAGDEGSKGKTKKGTVAKRKQRSLVAEAKCRRWTMGHFRQH